MTFSWDVLKPVEVRVDTRHLLALGASLAVMPERTAAVMGPIVQKYGSRIDEEVDANLSGRVLNVRSGEGRGSWTSGMTGPTTWEGENEVGYLALWETGFTASPGIFPVRGKRVPGKRGGMVTVPDFDNLGVAEFDLNTLKRVEPGHLVAFPGGKETTITFLHTKGGKREPRRWAGKALEAVEPEFLRAVSHGLVEVWTGLGKGGQG